MSLSPEVTQALLAPGDIPGCSGTRNLSDNLSDLRAQVAANTKGIALVLELIREHGLDTVQAYMGHVQVRDRTGGHHKYLREPKNPKNNLHGAHAGKIYLEREIYLRVTKNPSGNPQIPTGTPV